MMKRILNVCLVVLSFCAKGELKAQWLTPNAGAYGSISNRAYLSKTLFFPTYGSRPIGSASLNAVNLNAAALYYDSAAHKMHVWDPSLQSWKPILDSLTARAAFLLLTDTAAMLNPYAKTAELMSTFVPYTGATTDLLLGQRQFVQYQTDNLGYRDYYVLRNQYGNDIVTISNGSGDQGLVSTFNQDGSTGAYMTGEGEFWGKNYRVQTGAYEGSLKSTNLTAFRNYELPNKSGTFAMLSDIPASANVVSRFLEMPGSSSTVVIDGVTYNYFQDSALIGKTLLSLQDLNGAMLKPVANLADITPLYDTYFITGFYFDSTTGEVFMYNSYFPPSESVQFFFSLYK